MTDGTSPWFAALREQVYDVLVEECGATDDESNRLQFSAFWKGDRPSEYRFIGALGFGGKFWNGRDRWYVNCYREHETPERLAMIGRANARLEPFHARCHAQAVGGLV